jgi:hypothetical protein
MKIVDSLTGRKRSIPVDVDRFDDSSIESSSVYTTSIKTGDKLHPIEESEMEDKSGSNDDEVSRGSTIDTRKSIQSRLLRFKRNTKETFYSADGESLTGSIADYEDYDIADIEKQLQGINVPKPSTKKRFGNDPLEQAPTSSPSRNISSTEMNGIGDFFCVSKESAKKVRCSILLVFLSCIFFLISAGLIWASFRKGSSSEGSKASPEHVSSPLVNIAEPTASPITDGECIDDLTGSFYVDSEFQDCSYLASHPASQVLFCSPAYEEIYELCKKTCQKC